MIVDDKKLLKKVEARLNTLLEKDNKFRADLQYIQVFYIKKFQGIVREEHRKIFNNHLQKAILDQFHNGFLMISQYYNDEKAYIDETIFQQPEGIFTENVPLILNEIIEPLISKGVTFDEVIDTKTTHDLIMWSMEHYENIRPLLKQVSFDATCLGARQALREKGIELSFERKRLTTEDRWLGNIGDLQFVNPQMYLEIKHISSNFESWNINFWSSHLKKIKKIGEASVIKESELLNTKTKLSYNLQMLSSISRSDIDQVANTHISMLLSYMNPENVEYNLTLVTAYLTNDHHQ